MRPVSGGAAVGSLRSSCQAGVFGDVEEAFEGPTHHRVDVPRLDSFIHYRFFHPLSNDSGSDSISSCVSGSILAGASYLYHSEPMSILISL